MATATTRLALRKPNSDPTTGDLVNVDTDLNANYDVIDNAAGWLPVTAATHPSGPFDGQGIYETDTGKFLARTGDGNWHLVCTDTSAYTTSKNITVTGTGALSIAGTSTLTGNTTVGGTLGVTGTATLSGNATVGGTLGVTGAVTASAGLTVTGSETVSVNLTVGGAAGSFGGGSGVVSLLNAGTAPTTNPTGGGVLYSKSSAPFWRDDDGLVSYMIGAPQDGAVPTGVFAETVARSQCLSTAVAPITTGQELLCSIWLPAGLTVSNITILTGGTAGATMTHWFFELLSNEAAPVVRGHTADQTSGAIAANTLITKALVTPFVTTYSGLYYIGVTVSATTMPTYTGPSTSAVVNPDKTTPRPGGQIAASITTPGTDGTTTRTYTGTSYTPIYAYVS